MHKASQVMAAGADFRLPGHGTACEKLEAGGGRRRCGRVRNSQTTPSASAARARYTVVVVQLMPYGVQEQAVRFASYGT